MSDLKEISLSILKEYYKDFKYKYLENIKEEKIRKNSIKLFDKKINNYRKEIEKF